VYQGSSVGKREKNKVCCERGAASGWGQTKSFPRRRKSVSIQKEMLTSNKGIKLETGWEKGKGGKATRCVRYFSWKKKELKLRN